MRKFVNILLLKLKKNNLVFNYMNMNLNRKTKMRKKIHLDRFYTEKLIKN